MIEVYRTSQKNKSQIKKRFKIFRTELPLLLEKGLLTLPAVTRCGNGVTEFSYTQNYHTTKKTMKIKECLGKSRALGGNSGMFPNFRSRDLFLTKETLYQAELPRRYIRTLK